MTGYFYHKDEPGISVHIGEWRRLSPREAREETHKGTPGGRGGEPAAVQL